MRRTGWVCSQWAVVWLGVFLACAEPHAGAVSPSDASPTGGEAAATAPAAAPDTAAAPDPAAAAPKKLVTPAELPRGPEREDRGEPVAVNDKVLSVVKRVWTEPGDIPRLQVAVDGEKRVLPLEHTHVQATISGFVARVEVTQRYKNPLSVPIEATYVFPLPENSAVDDMKVRIGDRLIEADIQRRAQARETYEAAKREGYTAALLEQERPNIFTQSIANMEPGVDIEVIVRYVQDLAYDAGEYEFVFPMVVGPRFIPGTPAAGQSGTGWARDTNEVPDAARITPPIMGGGMRSGHDVSIEVDIAPELPIRDLDVPTHAVTLAQVDGRMHVELEKHDEVPNRDFVMRFRADRPLPQGAVFAHKAKRGGFFTLVVQPPTLDIEGLVGQREIVFVIDVSGSMSGVPLGMAKEAARLAIRNLRPVDTFNVITFAGQTARAFAVPRAANDANVREALGFVDAAMAGGGTYLANAVDAALRPDGSPDRHRYVFFLTDGYVGNEAQILDMTRKFLAGFKAQGRRARTFGFGVGSSVNRYLIDGLGKAGDGAAIYLTNREDPARAVRSAYRLIDKPVMTDVRIDWGGLAVADVEPDVLPDLLGTRPLILHGRYTQGGETTITVRGEAEGRPVEVPLQVKLPADEPRHAVLETLWARARIDRLARALWGGEEPEVVEQITGLGLDYRIVTAYTSFVAVDRSRKVGDGKPLHVVQPGEAPEGVDMNMAAPPGAQVDGSLAQAAAPVATLAPAKSGGVLGVLSGKGVGGGGSGGYGMHGLGAAPARQAFAAGDTGGGYGRVGTRATAAESGVSRMPAGGKKREAGPSPAAPPAADPAPQERRPEAGEDESGATRTDAPKPKLSPKVEAGTAAVTGSADVAIIREYVRRNLQAVRACYAKRLAELPTLAGKIVLRWTIGKDGLVTAVEVLSDTVSDTKLAACLKEIVKRWRFPSSRAGITIVSYPFVFAPAP